MGTWYRYAKSRFALNDMEPPIVTIHDDGGGTVFVPLSDITHFLNDSGEGVPKAKERSVDRIDLQDAMTGMEMLTETYVDMFLGSPDGNEAWREIEDMHEEGCKRLLMEIWKRHHA